MPKPRMNQKRKWMISKCGEVVILDGFDMALAGIGRRAGGPPTSVYDHERMVSILTRDMTAEAAEEYIDYHLGCEDVGPLTPIILERFPARAKLRGVLSMVRRVTDETMILRSALEQIAENKDEPYARDFAKDILSRHS